MLHSISVMFTVLSKIGFSLSMTIVSLGYSTDRVFPLPAEGYILTPLFLVCVFDLMVFFSVFITFLNILLLLPFCFSSYPPLLFSGLIHSVRYMIHLLILLTLIT